MQHPLRSLDRRCKQQSEPKPVESVPAKQQGAPDNDRQSSDPSPDSAFQKLPHTSEFRIPPEAGFVPECEEFFCPVAKAEAD